MTVVPPLPIKIAFVRRVSAFLPLMTCVLFAASSARAQKQEARIDDILQADRTKTSDYANKTFAASPAVGGKQATVHGFPFSHSAVLSSGDGSFQTHPFAGKDQFQTRAFATKADRAGSSDAFAQKDRGFATKALPVQAARDAGKTVAVREYVPGEKSASIRGKRQDTIDEIRTQKDLSIDEVREILNKPNGRPGSRPDVGTLPVMRAQAVNAPTAQ